ncbi:MAG: HAD-IA family hydrolase [Pseudomonadales bacterium]|nr:HAD-IA family hydrolase [Pseudomonadales bacterium]
MQAVLFDLDGTLVDTAPDFVLASNELRAQQQLPLLPAETVAAQVSNGALAVTKVTFDIDQQHQDFERHRQALLAAYQKHLGSSSLLYPGLQPLLDALAVQAIPWGVVTNKPVLYAEPLMQALGLHTRCATLVCPDHVTQRKPDPEGLLMAARQLGIDAQRCIYVGDHHRDIEAGKAANMHTVAVNYGYLAGDDDASDWRADTVVQTPQELTTIILQLLAAG